MRLDILDRGHRLRTKAVLALIRLVSRQPVVDAVKLALYRPDFYGGGPLTHEAMRGPSEWSIGDRELMAAFVSQVNECPFCVAAHSATSTLWYGDDAKVTATLADVETAPIEEPLRATLRMLGKLTREQSIDEDDIRAALAASVSPQRIEDALAVCLAFNITDRLANAFDFSVASPEAMNAGARHLVKHGYR
ncbi:putative peroxidase-related enzyme [Rhodococcus sp. PvR044]|uniref:carboxymuconolactone decarboxylase family protein n=1 Tax=Rhodococcus TaxID=1827 RepID=UPI001AE73ACE|nr:MULTISPECIES: alkylhydroperoxidase AhpD family core domain-containing protein [Rhodococcus]MBP1158528.1 putative peroxidase-related enzyme [Rhodococcus sp. PvR099]MCZ4558278.1 alkylhydroperoxidase AhpD family core domain-containing protein [Rhodococcus maanshanensis]